MFDIDSVDFLFDLGLSGYRIGYFLSRHHSTSDWDFDFRGTSPRRDILFDSA